MEHYACVQVRTISWLCFTVSYGPFSAGHGHEACWLKSDANDWSGRMQMGGQVCAITHLSIKRCS